MIASVAESAFRQMGAERAGEWVAKGHSRRHFFAHRLFQVPRCGPDGYMVARDMLGLHDLGGHWQLLLYAEPVLDERFPRQLFFDSDLVWHQQHFGRPGQVGSASMILDHGGPGVMHTLIHQSDLVQRIGLFREHKTQVEKRLKGWPWMVLNGILAAAIERGVHTVRTPTSELAMTYTDPARTVQPYLFERVYDRPPAELPGARREGDWWEIDVATAASGVVTPERGSESLPQERTVCVVHDLERGLGHVTDDPDLARRADATAAETLGAMLAVEADAGARVTYNVVGQIMGEVRPAIEAGEHALAFHSFDHGNGGQQLRRCREVDYRLRGYRLPRSEPTAETSDTNLAFHNFEWLASSAFAMQLDLPVLRDRLVRMPVTLDDFSLYTGEHDYETWERELLEHVARSPYTAVGLHDCYAHLWLPHYPALLEKLAAAARLRTLDEVSADVIMTAAA